MPSPSEILAGLTRIANDWLLVAAAWQVVLALALAAVATRRWQPSARTAALCASLPLASVSLFAWLGHNPFNGAMFALGAIVLGALALRAPRTPVRAAPAWQLALGGAVLAYGWMYPHFLDAHPAWTYLVAAPLGLVPCPTLSVVLGLALCARGFESRSWALAASALGLFYSVFGALRLGVWLDLGLLAAALATGALALRPRAARVAAPA